MESKKISVLMVDDDKFLADMYALKFSKEGYDVHSFLSVNDALKELRAGLVPDVILTDIVMPEHDGFFFLKALNDEKLAPQSLKAALTNQSSDEERKQAKDLWGLDEYIVKASMIPSEVVSTVARMCAQKK